MTMQALLLVNRQGKVRLAKWWVPPLPPPRPAPPPAPAPPPPQWRRRGTLGLCERAAGP